MNLFNFLNKDKVIPISSNLYFSTDEQKQKSLFEFLEMIRPSKVIYVAFFKDMLTFYPSHENVHSFCANEIIEGKHDSFLINLFLHNSCEVVLAQPYPLFSKEWDLFQKIKNLSGKKHMFTTFVSLHDYLFIRAPKEIFIEIEGLSKAFDIESKNWNTKMNSLLLKIQKYNEDKILEIPEAVSMQEWYSKVKWKV